MALRTVWGLLRTSALSQVRSMAMRGGFIEHTVWRAKACAGGCLWVIGQWSMASPHNQERQQVCSASPCPALAGDRYWIGGCVLLHAIPMYAAMAGENCCCKLLGMRVRLPAAIPQLPCCWLLAATPAGLLPSAPACVPAL